MAAALEQLRGGSIDDRGEAEGNPSLMGPYRLLEKIGQGGLGAVYLAERADGQFRRRVAVKVVRRDLVSPRLLEDLRLERQILARLEHPNIARLYDGGTGPEGQPFLAMELVDGLPVDRYCRPLPLGQRLELFLDVCSAVAHAHQRLVVHLDIKPSNILVTRDGAAKLLDFGIAGPVAREKEEKVQGDDLPPETDRLHATPPRRRPFTPDFASPEQAAGEPLTTATDVYSLGVLFYRLMSGRQPYSFPPEATRDEIAKALGEAEVEPPSRAARRDGQAAWKRLRGDLDAITAKAMARRPHRRYGSVQELADDIRHHLEHRPLKARPATRSYRVGRFLRRHRLAVGAVALVLAALAAGLVATMWSLDEARTARARAESHLADLSREERRAQRMIESFVDTFRLADPGEARGETISVRELVDRSVENLPSPRAADPELGARLSLTFGQVYLNLGSPERAQALFEQSLAYAEPHLGRDHFVPWRARGAWAEALIDQGRYDLAAARLRRDIRRYRREVRPGGAGLARLVHNLGVARLHQGEPRAAAALLRQAIRLVEEDLAAEDLPEAADGHILERAESRHRLAQALLRSGDPAEAERLLLGVLEQRRRLLGERHPATVTALGDLAALALYRGEDRRAADLFAEVLGRHRTVFGDSHPHVAVALQNLATAEKHLGLLDLAEEHLLEAVEVRRRVHGERHPAVADALYALGRFVHQRGDFEQAEAIYRQVLDRRRELLGEYHPQVAMALLGLADLDWSRGRFHPAERRYREVLDRLGAAGRGDTVEASYPAFQLGLLLARAGRHGEAEPFLSRALELRRRFLGDEHRNTVAARDKYAECRRRLSASAAPESPPEEEADTSDLRSPSPS